MKLRLGSLFSGWGGLDQAIEAAFASIGVEVELAWVSDIEQYDKKGHKIGNAPAILAHRYPDVPNLGDITRVDWSAVPEVDAIGGGSPCQDISSAGQMAGMTEGTRSNLWVEMREAIRVLKPTFVIWENVRGSLSAKASSRVESEPGLLGGGLRSGQPALRAFGRVLGDLASLGFDAEWIGLPASDIGAPHGRFREFILAAHPERLARLEWWQSAARETARDLATDAEDNGSLRAGAARDGRHGPADGGNAAAVGLLPTPRASDGAKGGPNQRGSSGDLMLPSAVAQLLPTPRASESAHLGRVSTNHGGQTGLVESVLGLLPTPSACNPNDGESVESWQSRRERVKATANNGNGMGTPLSIAVRMLPTPSVADATGGHERRGGARGDELLLKGIAAESAWGPYAAAIARWEAIHGPAPAPTKVGKKGNRKLNPEFSAWMMGAPRGWITDVPGITDNQASHAIGNGVVPHQGAAALRVLLGRISRWSEE